jgi:hypothetical protein
VLALPTVCRVRWRAPRLSTTEKFWNLLAWRVRWYNTEWRQVPHQQSYAGVTRTCKTNTQVCAGGHSCVITYEAVTSTLSGPCSHCVCSIIWELLLPMGLSRASCYENAACVASSTFVSCIGCSFADYGILGADVVLMRVCAQHTAGVCGF